MNRIPRCRPKNIIPQQNIKLTKKETDYIGQNINIAQVNSLSVNNFNNKVTVKKMRINDSSHRNFGVDISNQIKNNASSNNSVANSNLNTNANNGSQYKKKISNMNEKVRKKILLKFF